jgi:hypothetical protein
MKSKLTFFILLLLVFSSYDVIKHTKNRFKWISVGGVFYRTSR